MVMAFTMSADSPYVVFLGSVSGIPIKLHPSFFALLGLAALSSAQAGLEMLLFTGLLYGPILLVTIVVHELGHALMTKRLGGTDICIYIKREREERGEGAQKLGGELGLWLEELGETRNSEPGLSCRTAR
jgi:Zn-dependent protease